MQIKKNEKNTLNNLIEAESQSQNNANNKSKIFENIVCLPRKKSNLRN